MYIHTVFISNSTGLDKSRKEAERNLAGMKTKFSGSVEIFERAGRDTPLCMEQYHTDTDIFSPCSILK